MFRYTFVFGVLLGLLACSGAEANEYALVNSTVSTLPALPPDLNLDGKYGLGTSIQMSRKFTRPGFLSFTVEVNGSGSCEAKWGSSANSSVLNASSNAFLALQWKWTGPVGTAPGANYQYICNGAIESSAVGHIETSYSIFSPQGSMGISTGSTINGGRGSDTNMSLTNVGGTASITSPTNSTTVGIPPSVSTTVGGNNSQGFLTQVGNGIVSYVDNISAPNIQTISTVMGHGVNGFMSFSLAPSGAVITGSGDFRSKAQVISYASGITPL